MYLTLNLTHYNFLVFPSLIVTTRLIPKVYDDCLIEEHVSRANCPEVLLHLSSITNEDHLSLRKQNFLVYYCRDFESHNKFVKTLTSVKLCNSCYFNEKMHEQLLRFLINSHFLDGFN